MVQPTDLLILAEDENGHKVQCWFTLAGVKRRPDWAWEWKYGQAPPTAKDGLPLDLGDVHDILAGRIGSSDLKFHDDDHIPQHYGFQRWRGPPQPLAPRPFRHVYPLPQRPVAPFPRYNNNGNRKRKMPPQKKPTPPIHMKLSSLAVEPTPGSKLEKRRIPEKKEVGQNTSTSATEAGGDVRVDGIVDDIVKNAVASAQGGSLQEAKSEAGDIKQCISTTTKTIIITTTTTNMSVKQDPDDRSPAKIAKLFHNPAFQIKEEVLSPDEEGEGNDDISVVFSQITTPPSQGKNCNVKCESQLDTSCSGVPLEGEIKATNSETAPAGKFSEGKTGGDDNIPNKN